MAACLLLSAGTSSEAAGPVALLPFENVSGDIRSPEIIMPRIASALRDRGFEVVPPETLEPFLAGRRIRTTAKLSREELAALGREFGTAWVLVGSIDLFADTPGNPQWGVSSRLLEAGSGRILWADAAGRTGDDFTGFLDLGTITSPEILADKTVQELFRSLHLQGGGMEPAKVSRSRKLARRVFRDPRMDSDPPKRVAVLPFENGTERRGAALIVDDLTLVALRQAGRFEVADAGVVQRALRSLGIAPYGGIDLESLRRIGEAAGVDAVILGRVEDYNEGLRPGASTSPSIALDARMLETGTGKILWMGFHEAQGEGSQIVLEFGKIKSMVPLAMRVIAEMIGTM
ncbi:MAG TPA: GNA1162 family protein [Candidatus Methylomirabilis sp.]|nr:GNA1162 family protein [Candidatus Methylomirabilis sp.]HSB78112.1 GNA1162 family protein [Candidatus Methylomirabilis sp.]HSC70859.1 GNA1162 family protein [Candidatus Methylomirabilis sp.]